MFQGSKMLIFRQSLLDDLIRAVDQTKIFFYNVNDFIKLSWRNWLIYHETF